MPAFNVPVQKMGTVALSAQKAQWAKLEAVSSNLANSQTSGFKALAVLTQEVAYHKTGQNDISYVRHAHVVRDLSEGAFRQTGSPLHAAISGSGYFKVQTPQGVKYTRDGRFMRSSEGKLVTTKGYLVQSAGGGDISIPGDVDSISIASDGTIAIDGVVTSQLGVFQFDDESKLTPIGNGVYDAEVEPVAVSGNMIMSGGFEESNVQPVQEMVRMIQILRQYENIQKLAKVEDDQERKAMNIKIGS